MGIILTEAKLEQSIRYVFVHFFFFFFCRSIYLGLLCHNGHFILMQGGGKRYL